MRTASTSSDFKLAIRLPSTDLVSIGAIAFVVLQYLYILSFNYAPDIVGDAFAGAIALIHTALAVYAVLARPASWNLLIVVAMAMTMTCWLVAHGLGFNEVGPGFPVIEAFRDFSIMFSAIWLLTFPERLPHRLIAKLVIIGTVLGAVYAFINPPIVLGDGEERLGSITGGLDSFHPSAKFMAVQLLLLDLYRRMGVLRPMTAWSLIVLALIVMVGLGGRNELVLVIVYTLFQIYFRFKPTVFIRVLPYLGFVAAVIIFSIAFYFGENTGEWGSGRINVWIQRYNIVIARDLPTFLFGGGIHSDYIYTPQWRWMAAALAHSDFVHIMVERGLIGLTATCLMLVAIGTRVAGRSIAVLFAIIASSALSNGFLQQPMGATHAFLALAVASFLYGPYFSAAAPPSTEGGGRAPLSRP